MLKLSLIALALAATSADTMTYKTTEYGFAMEVPTSTRFVEKEHPGGWAGLVASVEGVQLSGLTQRGASPEPEAIEKFAVRVTGVGADHWQLVDQGKNDRGWRWYRTVVAQSGDKVAFGGYGVGKKGAYLFLLETTRADFEAHKSAYEQWYASIQLF